MKTLKLIVGLLLLANGSLHLLRGDWLGFGLSSALGWALLIEPKRPGLSKLRARLLLVALVCALIRLFFS
jgi:hypothetical protein